MMTDIQRVHTFAAERAVRKVVVVSKRTVQDVLDTMLEAGDYDIVFAEGIAHAYSRIKHLMPSMVIVCLSIDDLDGFHLLSMLKLDKETARIPVVTYAAAPVDAVEDDAVGADEDFVQRRMTAIPMN